ncbi:hypothetical protein BD413DRAFT_615587 [Trametes elegans]|nr:hypothetical protein BD413DRAFT_615587 [Trametes elegans]
MSTDSPVAVPAPAPAPAPAPKPEPDATPRTSADSRSDFIEQIFQKVEQESERRAREQSEFEEQSLLDAHGRVASPAPSAFAPAAPAAVSVVRDGPRDRRRGSISVSRFGQVTDLSSHTAENPSTLPSRTNSVIISAGNTGAFYQAQKFAGSADSFASSHEPRPDEREEEQVTQMETIAGRVSIGKAVGGLIARRLSRSRTRSRDILSTPSGLVIGVSVEEATTEVERASEDDDISAPGTPRTPHGTVVFAQAQASGGRSRRSTVSMPAPPPSLAKAEAGENGDAKEGAAATTVQERRLSAAVWVAKAKDLTKKFRRKSANALFQNPSP